MDEKDEIVISPKIIGEIFKKNLIFIIITVLLFSLGSFFVTRFFITKRYTSHVSLYVETESDAKNQTGSNNLSMYNYAQKLVATYIRMLDTQQFYKMVSESLNEKYTSSELKSMISFKNDGETEIFDVYVVSDSPAESKRIADAVAEIAPKKISDLNSKAMLKIADEAVTPTNSSYPNTTRNVLIAFAAGFVLSVAIAFIRHFADKKIKYSDEMTEIYDLPVLAAIPNFNSYLNQRKS